MLSERVLKELGLLLMILRKATIGAGGQSELYNYPGLFTSRDYGSDEEGACEGVVTYVEQAAMKLMP